MIVLDEHFNCQWSVNVLILYVLISRLLSINFLIYLCAIQVEFTFIKRDRTLWSNFGTQTVSREPNDNIPCYREYEVVSNEPLSNQVRMLILRSKDFAQVIPPGKHVKVKLNNLGEYLRFFSSSRQQNTLLISNSSVHRLISLKNIKNWWSDSCVFLQQRRKRVLHLSLKSRNNFRCSV